MNDCEHNNFTCIHKYYDEAVIKKEGNKVKSFTCKNKCDDCGDLFLNHGIEITFPGDITYE